MKRLPLSVIAVLLLSACSTPPPSTPQPPSPPAAPQPPAAEAKPKVAPRKAKPKKSAPAPSRPQKESIRSEESVIRTETLVI